MSKYHLLHFRGDFRFSDPVNQFGLFFFFFFFSLDPKVAIFPGPCLEIVKILCLTLHFRFHFLCP